MIKIFICDDDGIFAGLLTEQVRSVFGELGAECDVRTFSSSVECISAVKFENDKPDVFGFLDRRGDTKGVQKFFYRLRFLQTGIGVRELRLSPVFFRQKKHG